MQTITLTLDELTESLRNCFSDSNQWLEKINSRQLLVERGNSFRSNLLTDQYLQYFPHNEIDCERRYIPVTDFYRESRYQLTELKFSINCYALRQRIQHGTRTHAALSMGDPGRWKSLLHRYHRLQLCIRVRDNQVVAELRSQHTQQNQNQLTSATVRWIVLLNSDQEKQFQSLPQEVHVRKNWRQRWREFWRILLNRSSAG